MKKLTPKQHVYDHKEFIDWLESIDREMARQMEEAFAHRFGVYETIRFDLNEPCPESLSWDCWPAAETADFLAKELGTTEFVLV